MGVSRKQSTPYIPKNEHFLPHDTHMYVSISGGKKYSFFGKFSVLCFLEKPVLRFALLPYYRRNRRAYRVPSENNHLHFKFQLESFRSIMIKFLGLQDFLIFNSSHSNSHSFLPENVNKISYQLVMSWRLIRIKPIENSMTLRDIRNRAKKTNIMLISTILRNSIIHFKHNSFLLILEHNCNTNVVSIFLTSSESTLISIF